MRLYYQPNISHSNYKLINIPPIINIYNIHNINNTHYLTDIELKYQHFIETNQQILLLSNTIEHYLDIRDQILFQIYHLRIYKKKNYL